MARTSTFDRAPGPGLPGSVDDAVPRLVAHRGFAGRYPENTLAAVEAALALGFEHVEFDVQLTADRVPVVVHDASLLRTAGVDEDVRDVTWETLQGRSVAEEARLGPSLVPVPIPSLPGMVAALGRWPRAVPLVEIKPESVERFGTEETVGRVMEALVPVADRAIVISFHAPALECARRLGAKIGWCLHAYDEDAHGRARAMAPEMLLCNHHKLPAGGAVLWRGSWRWVVYEVVEPDLARALARRGVALVETMECADMLAALGPTAAGRAP